jgi:hypothetical protein
MHPHSWPEPGYSVSAEGGAKLMDFHEQITVIDGLIAAKWGPEVFKAMRAGGLTAVNATCIAWEGTRKTSTSLRSGISGLIAIPI